MTLVKNNMEDEIKNYSSFESMNLYSNLIRGIYSHGFEKPSNIQQQAIVPMTTGKDLIAQSQSGTGKTGAFTIGMLQLIDYDLDKLQVVVLSPTRELAIQTNEIISSIGEFVDSKNICHLFVGGTRLPEDIKKLHTNPKIAVGTPGRIWDLIERGELRTENLKLLVLDEADEMLSTGFADQIYNIIKYFPKNIQIALFSATIPNEILEISKNFMRNPIKILTKRENVSLDGIKQFYINVERENKLEVLIELYETITLSQSIIFVNTKKSVDHISSQLITNGYEVSCIHSDMKKEDRENIMGGFKSGLSRILITTDLTSRGIDIHHVNIVINYDISDDKENYIHRIGRCGRYGKKGIAINFVSKNDKEIINILENHYHIKMEELSLDFVAYLH